jgi:beta-glucosidase
MTFEEQAAQLCQPIGGWQAIRRSHDSLEVDPVWAGRIRAGIAAVYGLARADPWTKVTLASALTPADGAAAADLLQRLALNESRLGIPLLFSEEGPHGHMAVGATIFPTGCSLGQSWDPEVAREVGAAMAAECRARGGTMLYAPIIDVAEDPRWSRCEESFGEDPLLVARLAAAQVEGIQGAPAGSPIPSDHCGATMKHAFGHGAPQGGHNAGPARIGPRELREVHAPPVAAASAAGAMSVMASYNEIDGVPCHANPALLTDLLRTTCGFAGLVVGDGFGMGTLEWNHHVACDQETAARMAVAAGVDLALWDEGVGGLGSAVRAGRFPAERLAEACGRILAAKFRLGLFERPFTTADAVKVIGCSSHQALAVRAAAAGMVLIENRHVGDGPLLPLNAGPVAVLGPHADDARHLLGDYTAPQAPGAVPTILAELRRLDPGRRWYHARGCSIRGDDSSGIAEAVALARQAGRAVLCLGGSSARLDGTAFSATGAAAGKSPPDADCGEGLDRCSLEPLGAQLELAEALAVAGVPTVAVIISGRPMVLDRIDRVCQAILVAGYPGGGGGTAIARALLGHDDPAGRLSMSWPASVGALPCHVRRRLNARSDYCDGTAAARWSMGHGLSYASLELADLELMTDPRGIDAACVVRASAGAAATVVQLWVQDACASVTRPPWILADFRRLRLDAGATCRLVLRATHESLAVVDYDLVSRIEPGLFRIRVTTGSGQELTGECELPASP